MTSLQLAGDTDFAAGEIDAEDDPIALGAGPNIGRVVRIAFIVIAAFAAIFVIWGFVAPLSKAAIAPGVVQVEGRRRTVQHLEGGIVSEILVRENMRVRKGQPLMRLDTVQSGAAADAATSQYYSLLAEEKRLQAELSGQSLTFDDELKKAGDRASEIMDNQRALMETRRASLAGQADVLRTTWGQAQAEISSLEAQVSAHRAQLTLLRGELETVQQLVNEQLERRSRLLELQRAVASAEGQIGNLTGQILRARRAMSEAQARIGALTSERRDETQARLRDVQMQLSDVRQRLKATTDVNQRRTIVAPVDGQVVELRYTTIGGVVRAGEPVMDIVPERQRFVIMAQVRPIDIENVIVGLPTEVRLLPYSGRKVPMLMGHVSSVSLDAIMPEIPGAQPHYAVEVELDDPDALKDIDVKLLSGMPTDTYIILGKRTLFSYLFQPLTDSFRRAFREN
jgi:type I secretion membrane fusion protein, HlyD family